MQLSGLNILVEKSSWILFACISINSSTNANVFIVTWCQWQVYPAYSFFSVEPQSVSWYIQLNWDAGRCENGTEFDIPMCLTVMFFCHHVACTPLHCHHQTSSCVWVASVWCTGRDLLTPSSSRGHASWPDIPQLPLKISSFYQTGAEQILGFFEMGMRSCDTSLQGTPWACV